MGTGSAGGGPDLAGEELVHGARYPRHFDAQPLHQDLGGQALALPDEGAAPRPVWNLNNASAGDITCSYGSARDLPVVWGD